MRRWKVTNDIEPKDLERWLNEASAANWHVFSIAPVERPGRTTVFTMVVCADFPTGAVSPV